MSFLSNVNECVTTRESKAYVEGLNSKGCIKHLARK